MDVNGILNSNWAVRSSTAGNPNTPVAVLEELAKDSNCDPVFIISETYVEIKGTSHLWHKHNADKPFYTCGCFIGSREQLLSRIYSIDNSQCPSTRMRILEKLDKKIEEVFK